MLHSVLMLELCKWQVWLHQLNAVSSSGLLKDMSASLHLTKFQEEAATSGLNFVAGIGAVLVSGNLLDRLGRRMTLLIASICLVLGAAMVSSSYSFAQLLVGRALQGMGSGASWCACSVYITELAPPQYRGALVAMSDM